MFISLIVFISVDIFPQECVGSLPIEFLHYWFDVLSGDEIRVYDDSWVWFFACGFQS